MIRGRLNDLPMKVLVVTASPGEAAYCEGRSFGMNISPVKGIPLSYAPLLGIFDRVSVPLLFPIFPRHSFFRIPCSVSANVFQCSMDMDKVLPTDLLFLPCWSPLLIIAAKD